MIVNLGCGNSPISGCINTDYNSGPEVDKIADLNNTLPFFDNTIDIAIAIHVLEHVNDLTKTMKEIARILKPGGFLVAWVPYGLESLEIPFHKRIFVERTINYLIRGTTPNATDLDYRNSGFSRIVKIERIMWGNWHLKKWLGIGHKLGKEQQLFFILEAV